MKIPVGKTIAFAYAFTFGQLGKIIGLAWLPALTLVGLNYLPMLMADRSIAPAELRFHPELPLHGFEYAIISIVGGVFFGAMLAVGLVRQALGVRNGGAVVYFPLGSMQWRMFGAHLRYLCAAIGVFIIFYVGVLLVAFGGAALIAGLAQAFADPMVTGAAGIVTGIAFLVLLAAVLATLIRMGFFLSPTVVAERPGGIKRSYDLSKGNAWRLLLVWLAVTLPLVFVLGYVDWLLVWRYLPDDTFRLFDSTDPQAMAQFARRIDAAVRAMQARTIEAQLPLQAVAFVYVILNAGLSYGAASFAYRALVPPPKPAVTNAPSPSPAPPADAPAAPAPATAPAREEPKTPGTLGDWRR